MRRRVNKQEAIQLVKRVQFLYSFISDSNRQKLLKSFNNNPLRRFIKVDQLHEYIEKHDERSERIYFVVEHLDYDQTVDTDEIDAAIRNIKYLIKEQLTQFSKN